MKADSTPREKTQILIPAKLTQSNSVWIGKSEANSHDSRFHVTGIDLDFIRPWAFFVHFSTYSSEQSFIWFLCTPCLYSNKGGTKTFKARGLIGFMRSFSWRKYTRRIVISWRVQSPTKHTLSYSYLYYVLKGAYQ